MSDKSISDLVEQLQQQHPPLLNRPVRPLLRSLSYNFPIVSLEPGEEKYAKIELTDTFRATRFFFSATMREIRGSYAIRRTRLPQLDREDVVGYSTLRRWSNGKSTRLLPGRTVIEYRGWDAKPFTRSYQPSSVCYIPVDATQYVMLMQVFCGREPAMPTTTDGTSAVFFSSIGADVHIPATSSSMMIRLKNIGDVQVHVHAAVFGIGP